jgi:hypothetical protein
MMDSTTAKSQLVITQTELPVLRAGWGNIFIFVMIVWSVLIWEAAQDFHRHIIGGVLLVSFNVCMLYGYLNFVAKVFFYENKIKFITTLRTTDIFVRESRKVRLGLAPLNSSTTIRIKLKDKFFPKSFRFVVMESTNMGSYRKTLDTIEQIFCDYGVPLTKTKDIAVPLKRLLRKLFHKKSSV